MNNKSILDALASRAMFVLYRLVARENGKTDKVPSHPMTGGRDPEADAKYNGINAQDSKYWMTPDEALMWADVWTAQPERWEPGVLGYGVGLVIHEGCGFFFLDLDACRDGAGWQPHVQNFLDRFPGAARETSVSGGGVHVFGSYKGARPIHGTRNKTYHMELYTGGRFAALGDHGSGDIFTDCTDELANFAAQFFPAREEPEHGVEWTDRPVEAWRGPADDSELLTRAYRSMSAQAVFGGGASFKDLWEGNAEVLGRAFPSQQGNTPWDGSAADQALANHLSFWTGNDCERMLRLFLACGGLRRPKWERIDNYVKPTILRACADQREWYCDKSMTPEPEPGATVLVGVSGTTAELTAYVNAVPEPPKVPTPPPAPKFMPEAAPVAPGERAPLGAGMITLNQQKQQFAGMCYVTDVHKIQLHDGLAVGKERFDVMYGGRQYITTIDGQRPNKSAWECFTNNEVFDFPQVLTQYFLPGVPVGTIRERDGHKEINSYQPAIIERVKGDPAPFLNFLAKLVRDQNDRTILLSWLAASVRYLGVKFMWSPFIQAVKGNGKTTIGRIMEHCHSQRYTHWAKSSELHEKFNSVFVDKTLLIVDETRTQDQTELQEILKLYVTSRRIEVRPMYAEKMMKDVVFNMLLFSNHKQGVRIDKDERRFAPFYCAQQYKPDLARDGLHTDFFIHFNRWLEGGGFGIIYDYLMSFDIPEEYNPATSCIVAPITTSTPEAIKASLGGVEQEVMSAIEQRREGFRGGWVSSVAIDHLLAQLGRDKAIPRNMRHALIVDLGYDPHPALPDGLCSATFPDGSMPRLYTLKGHPWAVDYLTPEQCRDGFLAAQGS